MQYVEVSNMADIPNPNPNPNPDPKPTGGNDSEKMLQLLESANTKVSTLASSIDNINDKLSDFGAGFNKAAESVKFLNDQLNTLKRLKNINMPQFNGNNASGAGTARHTNTSRPRNVGGNDLNEKYISDITKKYKEAYEKVLKEYVDATIKSSALAFGTDKEKYEKAKKEMDAAYTKSVNAKKKVEHSEKVDVEYKNIEASAKRNKLREEAQKRYDAENPKDVLKETLLGKFNTRTQRTLKALTDLGKQKGGPLGAISKFAQNVGSNVPAMTAAAIGVGLLVKEIKFLSQCSKEAQENLNKAAQSLTAMGVGLTDSQNTAMESAASRNRLSNRWKNFRNNVGITDFWNNMAYGIDTALEAVGGTSATEPDSVKYGAMAYGTNKAYQSGFNWQSSVNLGENIYDVLADLVAQKFPQFKGDESAVTASLVDAIFSGSSKSIEDFGLNIDSDVLTGWAATRNERNSGQANLDLVNVEYTEAYKQLLRYEMLLEQLSEDSIAARQKDIQQWKTLGSVMEKCKQTLFSFDEVINLNAYDTTIPEYGWQWSNRVAVPADATKEEADKALKETKAASTIPGTTLTTNPLNWLLKLFSPSDKTNDNNSNNNNTSGTVKLDRDTVKVEPDTVRLDPTVVTLDTGNFNDAVERLRVIFNNFAYNILALMSALNNIGIQTGTPGVGPVGDITTPIDTPITDSPSIKDNWKTLLYKQLEQDFLNRLANGGSGPSNQASGLKEWGFAWGGPGSASDILIDVTGNNNYIGNRRKMTESEAREWASNNYYRFGPDEDGSTPARGVDIGNFYQPNSSSSSDDSSIFEDILSVIGDLTGITKLANRAKGYQEGDYDIWGLLSGIGSFAFSPWGIVDDALYGDIEKELRPVENGGIGTRGIGRFNRDILNNTNIDYGNTGENASGTGSNAYGGDSIAINLTLSGLNIANNQSDWQWVAQKIAEEIDVQRQRRGELSYGAS